METLNMNDRRRDVTKILMSCLTGKPVWVYIGPSKDAMRMAYWRACKAEIERAKNWPKIVAEHRANISAFISKLTASIPPGSELTPVQKAALKKLRAIEKQDMPFYSEFYDHIMEERRRRAEDREIRRQMREREAKEKQERMENTRYDK